MLTLPRRRLKSMGTTHPGPGPNVPPSVREALPRSYKGTQNARGGFCYFVGLKWKGLGVVWPVIRFVARRSIQLS
jgi:hypothetical protein